MSEVGGRVYDFTLNGCQPRAWPCSYIYTLYVYTQEFCRTRCRVQFVALPSRTVCLGVGVGECAGMLTPGRGWEMVIGEHTHTCVGVCVCVCSVCLARGEGMRPSVCRINIIKGNFQSAAAVTREGARAAHAAATTSGHRRRCRLHSRTMTPPRHATGFGV